MLDNLIHIAVLLLVPPLLPGVIAKTKAWFAGRDGPPLFQPYYDIAKCLRRGWVVSETTTWIFLAGPVVTLAATLLAGLMVPLGRAHAPIAFTGDLVLFAYLFGLARFFTTSAALDTGSAFEGMGAAREVTFACLSEPALFFAFLVLAKISGAFSLTPMLHAPTVAFSAGIAAPLILILIGLFIVLLAETCRIPVDDPNTHLELTMIHEAMVLDHSGPLFGIILYAAAMKMLVLGTLVLQVLVPFLPGRDVLRGPLFLVLLVALAVLIGGVESVMARLKMRHVPYLLVGALLFCGFGFILLIR
ncbi:MAG TPA: NADH-quinone oxidoreductase subunit H [Kiritimatiellia bacterium]|jgi:formate hydrogenlyase subunit 4|nr:MAG: Formate hydrogenlyase subunit 4 [Verrucomicrobia bacterium ADurb.Bin070]HPB09766.1 NADH-quinone oxidoreductase subunit H [Kiritimatiellia bacterium]HPO37921.1 NADH-quinone oxidoreductase subunit H [Kiritimatiellia bacterium]HQL50458.1 NADH-quinone oxidoreductase subunit H [Kiritimatiellia bacterium]